MPEFLKLVRQAFRALHYLVDVAEPAGQVEGFLGRLLIVRDCFLPESGDVRHLCCVEDPLGSHVGWSTRERRMNTGPIWNERAGMGMVLFRLGHRKANI